MFEKRKPYRNKKILDAARGEQCTMMIPGVCNMNPETVVFAHSRMAEDGHGMGQKSDDCFGAFMCSSCHDAYDLRDNNAGNIDVQKYFNRAIKRTWRRLLDKGVLK